MTKTFRRDTSHCTDGGNNPSILVYVGADYIGDAVMKLPFVYGLRQAFPMAHITWVAGKGGTVYAHEMSAFVEGAIDEIIENAAVGSQVGELFGARPLAGRRFDIVIDTQRRILTTLILRRIEHGCFVSGAARFLFSSISPKDLVKPKSMVRQLAALIALASGRSFELVPGAPKDPAAETMADLLLPAGPCYVGFAPGAGMSKKRWPMERYISVAKTGMESGRVPVFLLGPGEAAAVEPIRSAIPEALMPLQQVAEITPAITISLSRRLTAAVANDSGAGHLIAASGAPLVSLFGPTSPDKFAPVASRLVVVKAQDWGHESMDAIPIDAVTKALDRLIHDSTPRIAAQ